MDQFRISAEPSDPGFAAYRDLTRRRGHNIQIFVDDRQVDRVITADPVAGLVERYVTNEKGDIVITPGRDALETETLRGSVRWTI